MAINGENKAAIKALVTAVGTTEADFRTGTDHVIEHVDALDGSSPAKTETFLSSGNYTVPAGVNYVLITGAGGGSGGWETAAGGGRGAGGSGGAWAIRNRLSVTGGTTYAITPGAAGTTSTGGGNDGGDTTFGNIMTLGGGAAPNVSYVGNNGSGRGVGGTHNGLEAGGLSYNGMEGPTSNNSSPNASGENWIGKFGSGGQTYNNTTGNNGQAGFMVIEVGE